MANSRRARPAHANHFWSPRQLDDLNRQRQALLDQARAGSSEAIGDLLQSYWPAMNRYFGQGLSRKLAAKVSELDLTQSACLLAWRAFAKFTGSLVASFRKWLMQICERLLNGVLRYFRPDGDRDLSREQPLDEQVLGAGGQRAWGRPQAAPDEIVAALELSGQLHAALDELPADEGQIFTMRQNDNLTFAEIAGRLGLSCAAGERAFKRVIARLKLRLAEL